MEFKATMSNSLGRFNWKLYLALLLTAVLPTIYTTVRINFLGDLPGDWGFNIASQLAWVNLMLEVIQEALILPLFFCIGITIANKEQTINRVRTGMAVTLGLYLTFTILILLFANSLVEWMAQNPDTIDETATYIRLEMIGSTLFSLVRFLIIVFILMDMRVHIYAILGIQVFLTILFDSLFLSTLDFSLELGVNGIAYSNAIASFVTLVYATVVFSRKMGMSFSDWKTNYDFTWLKSWWDVGKYSGLDSFVRNLFYMLFIVRMMNVLEEQGTYWVANGFIWGWLLLPFYPLADLLKQDTSQPETIDHKEKTFAYFGIATVMCVLWILTIPLWDSFMSGVMNVPDYEKVTGLVLILLPFYILFSYNTLMDSVFYGKGRTELLAYQSIITNVSVYGTAFLLFQAGIFAPTLTSIALLFGTGIAVDSIVTYVMYRKLLKDSNGMI
jgi:Na+-driven multidrug efflux pump